VQPAGNGPSSIDAIKDVADKPKEHSTPKAQSAVNGQGETVNNGAGTVTQSFMLPELPNLSELVSGIYRDGTPIFGRTPKSKSRFSSAAHDASGKADHVPVGSVPLPSDEKHLFVALQLLQDRVADLEKDKADAQLQIDQLKHKNIKLMAEKKESEEHRHHEATARLNDSGIDDGEDTFQLGKKLIADRTSRFLQLQLASD
jgi:hypothetical protein